MSHTTVESSTIAEPMDDNQALREILGEVRLLGGLLREQYDEVQSASGTVSLLGPLVRPANPNIVKTSIINTGGNDVYIYEDDALLKILPIKETWVSPLSGNGVIKAGAIGALESSVVIASYLKE